VVYETPVIGTNKYGDAVESPLAQFGYACCANGSLLLGRGGSGLDYAEYNVVKGALIEPTPLPAGLPAKLEAYQLVMERGQTTLANVAFGGRDQTDFYVRWVASGGLWG
jgi:hypothetical protein